MTPSLIPIDIFIPKWLICLMDICGILSLKLDQNSALYLNGCFVILYF